MDGEELAVHVLRPDGTDVRIGPIPYQHVAESIQYHFTQVFPRSRAGAEGCVVAITTYDDKAEHLPLVPANQDAILNLLDDPVQGAEAPFPDLWDRLCAQHGYDVAQGPWDAALRDWDHYQTGAND